jgi:steroid delta-isomerase-like uncharacterized protein
MKKQIIQKWVAAFNARDARAVAELYHEDAINLQVAIGIPLVGRVAIQENMKQFFEAFPDNYTNIVNLFEDGDWVILEWEGGGTLLGAMGNIQPTQKHFKLQGCGFFQIVDGKIKVQRGYWDKETWFKQIGV